jgi:tryptophan 2,3-dioxygenase
MRYSDYLELDTLLRLQRPRAPGPYGRVRSAEHLFIVVHQCSELWLAQILLDLDQAALALYDVEEELALEHLSRVHSAFDRLLAQLTALDGLPGQCFAEFRPYLGTASGIQSAQFRALDQSLGLRGSTSPVIRGFQSAAAAHGLDLAAVCRADLAAGPLHRVLDGLLAIAQGYWRWKVAHLALVARLLGDLTGTAGSTGQDFLAKRVVTPFPELRAAQRAALSPEPRAGGPPGRCADRARST